MVEKVYCFLKHFDIIDKNYTLALAYSGGTDSSVLLSVIDKIKKQTHTFNILLIHINYNLRGKDSIKDREFAVENANKLGIPIYIKDIDAGQFENVNLQQKARDIRYEYFDNLYKENKFDYLLIAHNKDDLAETFIYKIITGSSLRLKKSFPLKRGYILRPMIDVSRNEIMEYIKYYSLPFRLDISNTKNKYARNKIRNIIMPELVSINKNAIDNITNFSKTLWENIYYSENITKKYFKKCIVKENGINKINIEIFKNVNKIIQKNILAKYLSKYEVRITKSIISECEKIILSTKPNINIKVHKVNIIKEYNYFYAVKKYTAENIKSIVIEKEGIYNFIDKKIEIKYADAKDINIKSKSCVYLNIDYPFIIRNRKEGDSIKLYPNGESKSIRKIFIDSKIPYSLRANIPIVEYEGINVSVMLFSHTDMYNRIDKEHAVSDFNKKIIEIKIIK